jgi:hypothetical protein
MSDKQKSVFLTFILSAFPGVGHYYLGLMNRGLQFMLFFIGGIVIGSFLDMPELAAFLPVIWFYALFDALQMVQAINSGQKIEDKPMIPWNQKMIGQKTIGWGFIIVGFLLLAKRILPAIAPTFYYDTNVQAAFVALLLIAAGIRILKPQKHEHEIDNAGNKSSNSNNTFSDNDDYISSIPATRDSSISKTNSVNDTTTQREVGNND